MKKSTKKVKKVLKDMPKVDTSDEFIGKIYNKIEEYDKPKWDEVDFDSDGSVHVGGGWYAKPWTWTTWLILLWIVMSYPLYVGLINTFGNS